MVHFPRVFGIPLRPHEHGIVSGKACLGVSTERSLSPAQLLKHQLSGFKRTPSSRLSMENADRMSVLVGRERDDNEVVERGGVC